MTAPMRLACSGCGWAPPANEPFPFHCANAGSGDDVDHVIARVLDPGQIAWPSGTESNPFIRYRTLSWSHHVAVTHGLTDAEYVELVERLDKEVESVDGRGFTVTPFGRADELSTRLGSAGDGGVWVKDETGNVSGSHKARHLMGLAIHLEVVERVGLAPTEDRRLAIASCGNAALAAAVVARAADRPLDVFVPTWADPPILRRLEALGASIKVCEREPGVAGDPTYHALQRAIRDGAIPFTCQGNENGLAIEGGKTIAYEMASQLADEGVDLHALFVQVGGGALASSIVQGLADAVTLGSMPRSPRIHTVQTLGGFPLKRAHDRLRERIGEDGRFDAARVQEELAYAARHRSEFMWPWEEEPKSIAHGILDDETYDWLAVVGGMLETGGQPIVVDERTLGEANELGRTATEIDVDHTGTSGLAGLLELRKAAASTGHERVAVLFTGRRREDEGGGSR